MSVCIFDLQTPDLQNADWVQVCLSVQCLYTTFRQSDLVMVELSVVLIVVLVVFELMLHLVGVIVVVKGVMKVPDSAMFLYDLLLVYR